MLTRGQRYSNLSLRQPNSIALWFDRVICFKERLFKEWWDLLAAIVVVFHKSWAVLSSWPLTCSSVQYKDKPALAVWKPRFTSKWNVCSTEENSVKSTKSETRIMVCYEQLISSFSCLLLLLLLMWNSSAVLHNKDAVFGKIICGIRKTCSIPKCDSCWSDISVKRRRYF